MYNDVKDADKYKIEVTYDGKDIKALLEYLFELEERINKAIEYTKQIDDWDIKDFRRKELLDILGDNENEN